MIERPTLLVPPGVEGPRLLRALAMVETSGGANNWPNVEESWIEQGLAFIVEGRRVVGNGRNVNDEIVRARAAKWGWLPTSASWGIHQILYHTAADFGYDGPPWLLFSPEISEAYVIRRLTYLFVRRGARTVGDLGDGWNSGDHRDANRVPEYRAKLEAAYAAAA